MALANYSELRQEIAGWLMRPDLEGAIPSFIRLAEAKASRVLRTQDQVTRSRATIRDDFTPLPDDWQEAWNIQIAGGSPLQYLPPHEMDLQRQKMRPGSKVPQYYSIIGRTIELLPTPDVDATVLEMVYFSDVPPLSADRATNWLLRRHPDVYLYGALIHSAPYLVDDGRLAVWQSQHDAAIEQISSAEARSRRSGAPLKRPN